MTDVANIGPTSAQSLSRLGIFNVAQLIRHYPLRYEDRITNVSLAQSSAEKPAVTEAEVIGHENFHWKNGMALKVIINDGSATASMLCFGRNFLAKKLPVGMRIRVAGPFARGKYGEIQSSAFVFEAAETELPSHDFGLILPVYALGGKLTQTLLRKALKSALARYAFNLRNELPKDILRERRIPDKAKCLEHVHFPPTLKTAYKIRKALIFEEFFHLQIAVAKRKLKLRKISPVARRWDDTLARKLIDTLPFRLTPDQDQALKDIKSDVNRPETMLRLIQGEVGSGKTLVAFIACLGVIGSGRQAAFMAPTELLSRQHADNAARLLEPIGIRIAFLSGEVAAKSRKPLIEALSTGEIDLIIGTHALFSSDIKFKDLAMIVIDEQHRFGVDQRRALADKGESPDILALSATPIPRTIALTAFGDMDVSSIATMPKGRLLIETHLARMGNEAKVYRFVRQELKAGNRAYFVYPLIEESEKSNLKDAENMFDYLSSHVFPDFKGALIHSRIEEAEKRHIMMEFREGRLDFLTATSVVEVGVDIPEATCMVVEHAERFGLSALHQLRGRVGRGTKQSYCFLVYGEPLTDEGKNRLMTMKNTNDGFKLAEEDMKFRGPGDMAGVKQSGFLKLTIADPVRDLSLLLEARDKAQRVMAADPLLMREENRNIRDVFTSVPPFNEDLLSTL